MGAPDADPRPTRECAGTGLAGRDPGPGLGPATARDPILVNGSVNLDGTVRVWSRDGALLAVLQPEGQARDIAQVAVLDLGKSVWGGAVVIALPESGDPWRWRVQPTLTAALAEAESLTHGRLDAATCERFFAGPCQP